MNVLLFLCSLLLFLGLLAALGVICYQTKLHYKEKEDIFIKLGSKSLDEAEFYRKEYPKRVEEKMKRLEEDRKNPPSKEEQKKQEIAKRF